MPINKEEIPKYRTSSPIGASQKDASIVVKVSDLINMAMGPTEKNIVNFKIIQTILHILARNMRLLDLQVELRTSEATPPDISTKEGVKTSRPESKDREKAVETITKVKEKADTDKSKDRGNIERDRDKKEIKYMATPDRENIERDRDKNEIKYIASPSSSYNIDEIKKTEYIKEREQDKTELAKLAKIREVYLREKGMKIKKKKMTIKGGLKADATEGEKHLKEKEIAKYGKNESSSLAASSSSSVLSSSIVYNYSDDDDEEEKLAKRAIIRKVYLRENEREEKAKFAKLSDKARKKSLIFKDEKEKAKHDTVDKYRAKRHIKSGNLVDQEQSERAKFDIKDRTRAESDVGKASERSETDSETYEIERVEKDSQLDLEKKQAKITKKREVYLREKEREMAKIANMDDQEREEYLKEKDKIQKAKKRERYDKEMAKLAKFKDKEGKQYLKDKEVKLEKRDGRKESERSETDSETYEIEGVEKDSQLDLEKKQAIIAQKREVYLREKERETAKIANMDDQEREEYLKEKDKIQKAKKRERYDKEIAKLKDKEGKQYLKDKEEKLDTEEKYRAKRDQNRESILDKEQSKRAKLDVKDMARAESDREEESERSETYAENEIARVEKDSRLDLDQKEEREMFKDRKRVDKDKEKGRERYETEIPQIEKMNDKEREKYIKDKKQREEGQLDAMYGDKKNKSERDKYFKQEENEESEKAKLDSKNKVKADIYKVRKIDQNEKEMAKLATMNNDEKEKYLRDKEQKEQAKLSELDRKKAETEKDEKENAKIALMNDDEKEKYLRDKEQKERAKLSGLDRKKAEREKDEKENAKLALMNETESEQYLKQKEKAKFDATDREREDRETEKKSERHPKDMEKLSNSDDEKKEEYFRDKEDDEIDKFDDQDRERPENEIDDKEKGKIEKLTETEREKYLKAKNEEDREKSILYGLDRERTDREKGLEKEQENVQENEQEKEREKEQEKEQAIKPKKELDKESEREVEQNREQEREVEKERQRALEQQLEREREKDREQKIEQEREAAREREIKRERERELDREREKEKEREKDKGREKEKELAKSKVGSDTRAPHVDSRTRVGSIEVVTRSEFELLAAKVNDLEEKTVPIPYPSMPDNQKLRTDLASGSASLTDTMQAMQIAARVRASEMAMGRMADLLTQLAAAGALPQEVMKQVGEVTAGMARPAPDEAPGGSGPGTSTAALPRGGLATRSIGTSSRHDQAGRNFATLPRDGDENTRSVVIAIDESVRSVGAAIDERIRSVGIGTIIDESTRGVASADDGLSRYNIAKSRSTVGVERKKYSGGVTSASKAHFLKSCVTHPELDKAQCELKDKMILRANDMVLKALRLAEIADMNVQKVADRMDIAINVAARVDVLFSVINDYAEQLAGFDAGVSIQIQNFNEQIFQIRCDLNDGIAMFTQTFANTETEALKELNTRYEDLVTDLDVTRNSLDKLDYFQNVLGDGFASIMNSVEALRAAKADREELKDGIRDKADKSVLDGLIQDLDFEPARKKMELRLEECYDRFAKQEEVWMRALEDLNTFAGTKASGTQLFNFTYQTEINLNKLKEDIQALAAAMGEPQAVILTRKLSEGGTCGPCQAPAIQKPTADCQPPLLPVIRRQPNIAEEPCKQAEKLPRLLDEREHICKRWTGGSHTLINKRVVHQNSEDIRMYMPPTKKFGGIGTDGKLYQLAEVVQPCADCNQQRIEETKVQEEGAGEPGVKTVQLNFNET